MVLYGRFYVSALCLIVLEIQILILLVAIALLLSDFKQKIKVNASLVDRKRLINDSLSICLK